MEEEYINFGDEQVSKQDLLKAINDYKAYSSTQPWSAARRGAFDAVMESALNRGILGTRKYTNPDSGESIYYTTFGGDPFDINTYDKNTKRGWEDASRFIAKLAESLPTKKSIDEKKKKEEEERIAKLPTFDSNSFLSTLYKNISDKEFGGQAFDGKTFDMNRWNTLDDVRDEKGAVGTDKRKEALAKYLEDIDKNFNEKEYNWKDSPFKDSDDFKFRLGEAVRALRSEDLNDDTPALNKLGINYKDWFNNRTGEVYTTDEQGNPITYGNYYRGLQAQKDAEAKQAAAEKQAKIKAYNANLIGGLKWYGKGLTGSPLSPENSNLKYLNQLAAKDSWNGDELSQLVGTFKLAQKNNALENLSREELATFGRFGNNPNRFKKIRGLNGIYWDSQLNQIAKPYARGQQNSGVNFQDILDQNNPEKIVKKQEEEQKKLRDQYSQRKEMTAQDWEYLASVVPDIASIVDVEPWTAGGLALTGAGMRHHALSNRPGGMSFTDKLWQGADYLGAGLAAVPGLGDAYLIGRALNTIRKVATPLFAIAGTYGLASSTINAIGKLSRDEDLTTQEKMDIVMSIPTLISAYRLRSKEGLNEAAKAANQSTVSSNKGKLKVTITDKSGNKSIKEINGLSEQKAKDLQKQFKQAGNDNSKKAQILKSDSEVQAKASEQGIDLNKVSIETDSRKLASYRKPTEIEIYQETNPSSARARYDAEIQNLRNSGKNWQARRLEIYDKFYRGTGGPKGESNGNWLSKVWKWTTNTKNQDFAEKIKNGENTASKIETPSETPKATPKSETNPKKSWSEIEKGEKQWTMDESMKEWKDILRGEQKPLAIGENFKAGDFHFNVMGHSGSEKGMVEINFKGTKKEIKFENQKDLRKKVLKFMKENAPKVTVDGKSKYDAKKMGEILRQLKAKGVFKHGGTIDKQRIQRYKEFIKK